MNWGREIKELERRWVTVVVVDIRGFTKVVNQPNISLSEITLFINNFFGITFFSIGGIKNVEINKFLGDGFLIFLGDEPTKIERHSLMQGIEMVFRLKKRFKDFCDKQDKFKNLALGIGIACGEIVYGPFGAPFAPSGGDITGIGEFVNLAFRLTGKAKKNQILTSEEVWRNINTKVSWKKKNLTLKGFNKTVCYEITALL
ncbi:MAG: adenylate/guanylate cyclase domain-containing protein [bacterium]|nr:adenylate/guanylate cyclase domain-containing protein [bacterium]